MAHVKIHLKGSTHFVELDLLGILREYGIDGDITGSEYIACCPFHSDSSPSWSMRIEGDRAGCWQCFAGNCKQTGDVLTLIQLMEGCSRDAAYQSLIVADNMAKAVDDAEIEQTTRRLRNILDNIATEPPTYPVPTGCTRSFVHEFFTWPIQKGGRGYTEEEYCSLHTEEVLYCESGFFRNRIVVPIHRSDGQQVSFVARSVDPNNRPKYLYPKGWLKELCVGVFPVEGCRVPVMCEGVFDALHIQGVWKRTALVVFGSSPSLAQIHEVVKEFDAVALGFDGDDAGRDGALKASTKLQAFGADVDVLCLPEGTDPPMIKTLEELACVKAQVFQRQWMTNRLKTSSRTGYHESSF